MQNTSWTYKQFALCITRRTSLTPPPLVTPLFSHIVGGQQTYYKSSADKTLHAQTEQEKYEEEVKGYEGSEVRALTAVAAGAGAAELARRCFFRRLLLWYVHYFYLSQWMQTTKRNETNRTQWKTTTKLKTARMATAGEGLKEGMREAWPCHTNMQNS